MFFKIFLFSLFVGMICSEPQYYKPIKTNNYHNNQSPMDDYRPTYDRPHYRPNFDQNPITNPAGIYGDIKPVIPLQNNPIRIDHLNT